MQTPGLNFRLAALKVAAAELQELETNAHAELERMRRESVTDDNLCFVCHVNEVNTLLLECRHCICCEDCAHKATSVTPASCPKCAEPILRIIKTFHS